MCPETQRSNSQNLQPEIWIHLNSQEGKAILPTTPHGHFRAGATYQ
uniref:Uncharacterized protein n=1 Tax=Anguilla anguilla TaxID=7936 RepID=A0A0E9S774_ANGAN